MGRHLGALGSNNAIHIHNLKPKVSHMTRHRRKQLHGVRPCIGRVRIREQLANVSGSRSAKHRIRHRMGKHICI